MILVTGSTGNVGREVVRQLRARGARVRALVREDTPADALGADVELARGDLARPETLSAAMRDVAAVYLLAPLAPNLRELEAGVIDAAVRAGVRRLVKHSNLGADRPDASTLPRWHREGELRIERAGLSWTFVRPTGFMSNARGWAGSIKAQGAVFAPAGEGRLAVVDPADIAAVAVAALTEPGHEGAAYDVTGPAALSMAEQVEILARELGRPLRYVDVPESAARDAMGSAHMPPVIVDALLEFMALVRAGGGAAVSDAVPRVTGRPARSFAEWVRANVAAFR